jgi:hypothetical protein
MAARTVEKIAVIVVVAVLGAALAVNVRGAPAALLLAALVVTVSAGMDLVLRGEARYHPTPDLFVLPGALVVGGVLFIALLTSGAAVVAGLAALAGLLFLVFWAEFHALGTAAGRPEAVQAAGRLDRRLAETVLVVAGFLAAFILYTAVYQTKTRSLLSAPAITAITFLLGARQLRLVHGHPPAGANGAAGPRPPDWPRTLMYSAAIALAAGEITWALNYWPLTGLLGGAFLLATFYFLVGIFSQHLQGRLSPRLVVEYGMVSAAGVLLIAAAGVLRRGF